MVNFPEPRFRFGRVSDAPLLHSDGVYSLSFTPDGSWLAGGRWGGTKVWSVASRREVITIKKHWRLLAIRPDGQPFAFQRDGNLLLWSVSEERVVTALPAGAKNRIWCADFSPDGNFVAGGTILPRQNVNSRQHNQRVTDPRRNTTQATVRSTAVGIIIWSISDRKAIALLTGHNGDINDIAFSPDGQTLASASVDRTIKLWSVAKGVAICTLPGYRASVHAIAFSPDGALLASGSWDRTIKLWSIPDGKELAALKEHRERIWSIAFSPDGRLIASGQNFGKGTGNVANGGIKVWSVAKRRTIASFKGRSPVAISPDGSWLAGMGEDGVKLWKISKHDER